VRRLCTATSITSGTHDVRRSHLLEEFTSSAKEIAEASVSATRKIAGDVRQVFNPAPAGSPGPPAANPRGMDPARFKGIIVRLLKILIVVELGGALLEGLSTHRWIRFGQDLVIAGILYVTWGRLQALVRKKKEDSRLQIERSPQEVGLFDALAFSLLWSDEIYADIPSDRRRLVIISYTLMAIGLLIAYVRFDLGLMGLVLAGGLVLGAANLVVWVVSMEREQRNSLQTELQLAREVQQALMPTEHPALPGVDIAGASIPAREVGGDLFQFSAIGKDDRRFGVSVIDVSGKGLQAAMSATFTVGALASEVSASSSPAAILTRLNAVLYRHSRRGHFVAFLLFVLDVRRLKATFTNAGQTKPLLLRDGSLRWLDAVGVHFPLGMRPDTSFEECEIPLRPGDVVLLLTDGFTDAMNARQEMFGAERLEEVLREPGVADKTAQGILDHVREAVQRFVGQTPQHDDMTMVVLRVPAA
jgi:serine phosphatase RsbU (regulator of sigma subunit)